MCKLLKETLALANTTKMTVSEICEAAEIKPRWYYDLLAERFSDPGVNKIERLHKVLKRERRNGRR